MITLEIGQLYGMNSEKELMQTIKELKTRGMSDNDLQTILDRSKAESEEQEDGPENNHHTSNS